MRFNQGDDSPILTTLLEQVYRIGCLYSTTDPTNPAIVFGFGTWEAYAAGRALVGVDTGDADFDTAGKTSGAKTVTLTEAQMPSHTHVQASHGHLQDPHTHTIPVGATDDTSAPFDRADAGTNAAGANASTSVGSTTATCQGTIAVNQNTGGGAAHPNVQPSIAIHIFRRTA
jgi:microcystin-dependent protein